jgi:hypothetical protein
VLGFLQRVSAVGSCPLQTRDVLQPLEELGLAALQHGNGVAQSRHGDGCNMDSVLKLRRGLHQSKVLGLEVGGNQLILGGSYSASLKVAVKDAKRQKKES